MSPDEVYVSVTRVTENGGSLEIRLLSLPLLTPGDPFSSVLVSEDPRKKGLVERSFRFPVCPFGFLIVKSVIIQIT